MRALVTGSAGFVGRHMVAELQARGYEVTSLDIAEFCGDAMQWFCNTDCQECGDVGGAVYDLVAHCAYHVGGRAAIDGTNMNFAKNLQLDAAVFEWAVRTKQKRVLYFSSSAAYPVEWQQNNSAKKKLEEDDISLMGYISHADYDWPISNQPDANYGWAKLTGELLVTDARRNGLAVTVVRPFSGYSEDQSREYPFPSILARAKAGDLSVWGPKGQTRDWIHVSDVVKGALAVVESGTDEPVNLCTGRGVEMGELAAMVCREAQGWPEDRPLVPLYDESKPTGVFYRVGDPTRMLNYYTPKVTLEEGISRALRG